MWTASIRVCNVHRDTEIQHSSELFNSPNNPEISCRTNSHTSNPTAKYIHFIDVFSSGIGVKFTVFSISAHFEHEVIYKGIREESI